MQPSGAVASSAISLLGLSEDTALWWAQVWDLQACTCLHTLRGHSKPVQKLAIRGGLLYSTAGRKMRVWDLDTFKCIRNVHTQDDGGALRALAVGEKRSIFVAGQVLPPILSAVMRASISLVRASRGQYGWKEGRWALGRRDVADK